MFALDRICLGDYGDLGLSASSISFHGSAEFTYKVGPNNFYEFIFKHKNEFKEEIEMRPNPEGIRSATFPMRPIFLKAVNEVLRKEEYYLHQANYSDKKEGKYFFYIVEGQLIRKKI